LRQTCGHEEAKRHFVATSQVPGGAGLLVLHGPNLNLLGSREPEHYGSTTLAEINRALAQRAEAAGVHLEAFQSNHEGALIERVHAAREQGIRYLIINPAAYTHTSVALRDALAGTAFPLSKYTSRTSMPANPSASTRIFPTWRLASSAAWAARVTCWRSNTC
jgi:hypothetical protein